MKTEQLFQTPLSEQQQRNSDLNINEFREGKTFLRSLPRRIVFELTNRCNFQCIMCGREAVNFKTTDMPVSVIKACEPFFAHAEEVTLHGWGEGTLHPKLGEILKYLNTFKLLRKYFVTNGSTLPGITEKIFEHHVDLVAVSLDGATAESNNSIRKGGNFDREVRSVRRLMEEKAKRRLDYPYVNFVFTAMARNIHELPAMVALAHSLGLPEVKVVYLTIFSEALRNESLFDRQETVKKHFDEAALLSRKLNINLKLPEIQGEGEAGTMFHKPCAFPWRDLYIGSDGCIRPCQSSSEKLLKISDYPDFTAVWNSREMAGMRERVNELSTMSKSCRNCYHSSCANWNLKKSFLQLGNTFAPEWKPAEARAENAQ